MKIALNMGNAQDQSPKVAQAKSLERDILAAKKDDWAARNNLIRAFLPLLTSLAQKRTKDPRALSDYLDAGKEGLLKAVKKYKPGEDAERFQIFVVDYVEEAMNRMEKGGGFWSRLFGR